MLLSLSAVILVSSLIFILLKFQFIKKYVRSLILLHKLPTASGKRYFSGHTGQVLGKSREDNWFKARDWSENSPHVYTVFLGPFLIFVFITGVEEFEATTAAMKHLEKANSYNLLHRWLKEGLLTSSGSKWQKRRKILTPAFHFSILLEFVDIFNTETESFLCEIEKKHLNQPVDVVPLISNFTLLTMAETSMGTTLDLKTKEGMKYKQAILQMEDVIYQRVIAPWLWYRRVFDLTYLYKLEKQALKVLHNFTTTIIHNRSQSQQMCEEKPADPYMKMKNPLLDTMLKAKRKDCSIDDKGIREEVDTFMFEGHDTTATCLNFTTMLFACHKDIQEEVHQEIVSFLGSDLSTRPTYNDLQQMALLERCIKESLRLYPPVPLIGRKLSEDVPTKFGTIPKGADTFLDIYNIHRDPSYWRDPAVFDPSRHTPENSHNRHPFAYVPFSAGPRNCIGQRFAMLEMKAFFCGLLRKFVVEPVDTPESLVMVQHLVLRSRDGIKVKFVLRSN